MLNQQDKANYLRLLSFVKPRWKVGLLAVLATLIYGVTEPLVPYVMQPLIDGGFAKQDMDTVYGMVAILIVGFIIRGVANVTSTYTTTWIAQHVVYDLRSLMFRKLLRLPMTYFDAHSNGSVMSRFSYDVVQLMSAVTDTLISLVRDSITIVALVAYLLYLDWKLTLILFAAAPFLTSIIIYISRRLRKLAHSMQTDMSGMNHVVDEGLRGKQIIRIFGGQQHESSRFQGQARSILRHALKSTKISAITSPIIEIIIIIALAAVVIIAAHVAQRSPDDMTAGKFVAFLGTMALLFPPIKKLGKLNEPLQKGLAAMQSVFEFLDQPEEQRLTYQPAQFTRGHVEFKDVSFNYGDHAVLEHFSLDIQPGESVALVGESGAGKSTVANLLAGFYQPQSGSILIDGHDLANVSLEDRRKAIAYVSQHTVLFSATVAENIAYADEAPELSKIQAAAKSANADHFIAELPEGYQSDIGQQGDRLSGGQQQRIAIARALYKDVPILILDEATSALDNRSEQKVQEAIEALSKNRTALIIAHRLTTIRNADRIVVLEHGKILESGSHDELIAKKGYYATLLNRLSS